MAAYAVMLRTRGGSGSTVLLSRLAPPRSRAPSSGPCRAAGWTTARTRATALIREIHEETGLDATVGETAHVYSAHLPRTSRDGQLVDAHAIRIVYDGWVAPDAPAPQVAGGRRLDRRGGLEPIDGRESPARSRWSRW